MTTAYDIVTYPNRSYPQTRPDRLAVLSKLFGLTPAPPDRCRMLELGCGNGGNLLPLAYTFPNSRFVGLDLAPTVIASGREAGRDLGLSNIELHHQDLLDFPVSDLAEEPFDYIVAHGVYSWVPPQVRDRLLAICRGRLAPHGVAFVSYNCLPGCHMRRMVREIMQFHTRHLADPGEKVPQAIAICQFIANSVERPDTHRQVFKDQLEQIQHHSAGHLFHDDLAEINDPCYFHQFMAHAADHGLQFLAEADFHEMQDQAFTPEVVAVLGQMADSRLTREQYLDFLKCRRFRQTLLCHHEVEIHEPPRAEAVETFHISAEVKSEKAVSEKAPPGSERFVGPKGAALEVDYPPAKAALHRLCERWPATLSFDELLAMATKASAGPQESPSPTANDRGHLATILLEAYRVGLVHFYATPVACVPKVSEKPSVSSFARWQVQRAETVTTLRGENLRIEDESGRKLLQFLDGSRSLAEIAQLMEADSSPDEAKGEPKPADRLQQQLQELARLGLLES